MANRNTRRGMVSLFVALLAAAFVTWSGRAFSQTSDTIQLTPPSGASFTLNITSFTVTRDGAHGTITLVRKIDPGSPLVNGMFLRGSVIARAVIRGPNVRPSLHFTNLLVTSQIFQGTSAGDTEIDTLAF